MRAVLDTLSLMWADDSIREMYLFFLGMLAAMAVLMAIGGRDGGVFGLPTGLLVALFSMVGEDTFRRAWYSLEDETCDIWVNPACKPWPGPIPDGVTAGVIVVHILVAFLVWGIVLYAFTQLGRKLSTRKANTKA